MSAGHGGAGGGQRFRQWPGQDLQQDEPVFEFKPLDLSSLSAPKVTRKVRRRVKVPCNICGRPGCYLEVMKEVEEPIDDRG